MIAKEWDYEKNEMDPDKISPHKNKKAYWICSNGHKYISNINNKTSKNGGDCPYCSHQRLLPENSLYAKYPELSKEWSKKNYPIMPQNVAAHSNKSVWWKCKTCGYEWKAKINNRTSLNRGCPKCNKGSHTSFPELFIFCYLKHYFSETINSYSIQGKYELDVYIPHYNLGIEYDGEFYHKSSEQIKKDEHKNEIAKNNGIKLIRIRESGCKDINTNNCLVYKIIYSSSQKAIAQRLKQILDKILQSINVHVRTDINLDSTAKEANDILKTLNIKKSFAAYAEMMERQGKPLKAYWDYAANAPLTPEKVTPKSDQVVSWICINNPNHKWKAPVKSISLGYGCSICAKRHHYTTEEWIEKAKLIHGNKYDYSKVNYVNAKTKVTIICKKHGEFLQSPSEHLSGKGCKYCAGQAFHPLESLVRINPKIAKEWDYEKNDIYGFTPETIGKSNKIKFWWKCNNGKPHSYQATIQQRLRGSKCAVCHGKQVSYDTSIAFLRPDLAKEWCKENKYKSSEVSLSSEKKILWKCSNPNHKPYYCTVYNRVKNNVGCQECKKKM